MEMMVRVPKGDSASFSSSLCFDDRLRGCRDQNGFKDKPKSRNRRGSNEIHHPWRHPYAPVVRLVKLTGVARRARRPVVGQRRCAPDQRISGTAISGTGFQGKLGPASMAPEDRVFGRHHSIDQSGRV